MPDWASDKSKILDNNTGPNSLTVALSLTPSCSDKVKISTGKFFDSKGMPIFSWRSVILG